MSSRQGSIAILALAGLHLLSPVTLAADVAAAPAADTTAEPANTILVLDGSGSMWGQIDGRHKILIARDVVGDVLRQLPPEQQLGLMAYGHNRKGDCDDIELIAEVGTDRESIRQAVNAVTPLGKTPLSAAVQRAATLLKNDGQAATVVLVSDGEETCGLDPCAVGAQLESAGVDFTAHVVGFGLTNSEQATGLRCLAETTGGRYFNAEDANGLAEALEQTIAPPTPDEPAAALPDARLFIRATDLAGGPEVQEGLRWQVVANADQSEFYNSAALEGSVQLEALPQGRYTISVTRPADNAGATGDIFLYKGNERTLTLALDIELTATLRTEPIETAPAGSQVDVYWEGPDRKHDWIGIARKGAPADDYTVYEYSKRGSPVTLKLPIEIGDFEVRYVLARPTRVLARAPIKTTGITATVSAAATAVAGAKFEVTWTGPDYKNDWIALVRPGERNKDRVSYTYTKRGSPLLLDTPIDPGEFEIRYVTAQGSRTLASQKVRTTPVSATLTVPATAVAGSQIAVSWSGPDYSNDWIGTAESGAAVRDNLSYTYTRRGSPLEVAAPPTPGDYIIKYISNFRILAQEPISITPVTARITAAATGTAGATLDVQWDGPNYRRDYISISKPGDRARDYQHYAYTRRGSPVTLKLPNEPGEYELRYVMSPGPTVLARQRISIE